MDDIARVTLKEGGARGNGDYEDAAWDCDANDGGMILLTDRCAKYVGRKVSMDRTASPSRWQRCAGR